jgi:two-component system, NarL family, sensor histidine kinase UhpB
MGEGIQSVIDEMRLMINSMDSVGESLAVALATFHERVEARIEAAGRTLVWVDQSGGKFPDYSAREVLQVFRILQEAVGNALKHSSGKTITVLIVRCPDPAFPIRITVSDDGAGMGAKPRKGRGLDNMRARAEAVGGSIFLSNSGHGLSVQLDIPGGRTATD